MKKLHGSELKSAARFTARQEQAIQALLTGANVNEAAKLIQVGRTTLYRWLNDAAFRTAYHTAQERSHIWSVNRLQSLTAKAIQVLERILDDAEAPAMAKLVYERPMTIGSRSAIARESPMMMFLLTFSGEAITFF